MDDKKEWVIEIMMTRTFYGTRRDAEDIADEDFDYCADVLMLLMR